ncbi:MAG TPA: pyruvate ferredoxin oxidoreductase, partial [Methanospirillum sp.]|uniref:pyruvate ferredoxin oxidoreductase n=1 Tax=Methanospirillum sp. TaxID=45200 RepID=UPI002B661DFA
DSGRVKSTGQALNINEIIEMHHGIPIMGNTAIIGAFCGCMGIPWDRSERILRRNLQKKTDINIQIAQEAYSRATQCEHISQPFGGKPHPLLSGNEWISLGLLAGGIDAYVSYPMTPSSGILHYLASVAHETGIEVIHPESEIAVILIALGFSYAGKKAAVGTSGGGFCLMTEGLSLAGMAEIPIAIVLSQRTGPSTGLPTYTSQSDLLFACHAGQGEFPRFVVAPATPAEAYKWSAESVQIAWKFQIPTIILSDKTLSEGICTLGTISDINHTQPSPSPLIPYKRYADTPDGISPLLPLPCKGEIIKTNSYTHDYDGFTTEDSAMVITQVQKRLRKIEHLIQFVDQPGAVYLGGSESAKTVLLCWGSPRGVCSEVAEVLGLRVVSPVVLVPFPKTEFKRAMEGVETIILVEESSMGQLNQITERYGCKPDHFILRYDGRPFAVEELVDQVQRCIS